MILRVLVVQLVRDYLALGRCSGSCLDFTSKFES